MKTLSQWTHLVRKLAGSERGNVAIVFALTLPVVVGGAGFGVETSYWYFRDLQIQAAADAAAYAAAIEKRSGSGDTSVVSAATLVAAQNGFDATIGTIQVNTPPLSGPNVSNPAVEVIIQETLERYFSKIFVDNTVQVNARAVANYQTASNACVLALDPSASKAVLFSGNSSLSLIGCSIMANSIAADAVKSQGSSDLAADCIVSAGGVDVGASVSLSECAAPVVNAPPVSDPFAELDEPEGTGSCKGSGGATLHPGKYCGGININSDVELKPGVYYVSGGDFKVNANGHAHGEGVTIFLADNSRVSMNGNSTVELSAPTNGTYSGILFFGDRESAGSQTNTFNGTADSKLTGTLYFPAQPVAYLGTFAGESGCTRIVAKTIEWSGDAEISQDCSSLGMASVPATQIVNLAE